MCIWSIKVLTLPDDFYSILILIYLFHEIRKHRKNAGPRFFALGSG